jgi:hypothetical protein
MFRVIAASGRVVSPSCSIAYRIMLSIRGPLRGLSWLKVGIEQEQSSIFSIGELHSKLLEVCIAAPEPLMRRRPPRRACQGPHRTTGEGHRPRVVTTEGMEIAFMPP